MYCRVNGCKNNNDGYCEIASYIIIQEDGTCDNMLIISEDKEDE